MAHLQAYTSVIRTSFGKLKDNGVNECKIEGKESNEWKLVDGIDLIVHIFHPEKESFTNLKRYGLNLFRKKN